MMTKDNGLLPIVGTMIGFHLSAKLFRKIYVSFLPPLERRRYLRRKPISKLVKPSRSRFFGHARMVRQRWAI